MAAINLTDELTGGSGSSYDSANNRVIIAERGGRISALSSSGRFDILGSGYGDLVDVDVDVTGRWAIVTQRGGEVFHVDLANADRSQALVITSDLIAPHQIVLAQDRLAYVVEFARSGRLVTVDLRSATTRTLVNGLRGAIGLALSADLRTAYVTETGSGGGRITEIVLATGQRRTVASALVNPFMLTWANPGRTSLLVAERDPANRITEVRLRRRRPAIFGGDRRAWSDIRISRSREFEWRVGRIWPTDPTMTSVRFDGVAWRPSSVQVTSFGDVVISDQIAELRDGSIAPSVSVELDAGGPMFPAEYRRIGVNINGPGVTFDDLEFVVVPGSASGQVSYSTDDLFDPLRPEIMVLAGSQIGDWKIEARRRANGTLLGVAELETNDVWSGSDGPPIWFEGSSQPNVLGATWGGGVSGSQNVDLVPASGTHSVAMLLVDTADARYPADTTALNQTWEDETINGVPAGTGPDRSVRQFFREASGNTVDSAGNVVPRFDIALDGVHGPVQLSGNWEDYFQPISATDDRWQFKTSLIQAAASAADDLIDFSQVDSFVVVVNTVPGSMAADPKMAWPYAWGMVISSDEGNRDIPFIVMPHDWDMRDTRAIHETLSHELGHNLGLGDLYMDSAGFGAIASRDVDELDVMSFEGALGHQSAPNKIRLGWIRPGDIATYDFSKSGAVDDEIVLHASSLGTPPAGRVSAVEIRIADGWNYCFEYRSEQDTGIGDQDLGGSDRRVIGTDVVSPNYTAPIVRREIILLPNDPDGDGPILGIGDDYREKDSSTPTAPADFKVEVLDTDDDWARIQLSYGTNSKPDPSIRPWSGTGTNAWQSPDIEVFNARNLADSAFKNLPWTAHQNRIVARVKNLGSLLATDVRVNFSVKDLTVSNPVETPLGVDINDIPAGSSVEFEFDGWVPPAGDHFCVVARIPLHVNNDALNTVEMTELNNLAQSNYAEFISAEASPPRRQRTMITVSNPYPRATTAFLSPVQTNPFFRTYLATSMILLEPGEERKVEMMVEALHGTPDEQRVFRKDVSDHWLALPNHVSVSGFITDPHDPEAHTPLPTGGVNIRVRTGKRTQIMGWDDSNTIGGRVTASDGRPVERGRVVISIRESRREAEIETQVADVKDGVFFAEFARNVDNENLLASVEYLGAERWAPSEPFTWIT